MDAVTAKDFGGGTNPSVLNPTGERASVFFPLFFSRCYAQHGEQ